MATGQINYILNKFSFNAQVWIAVFKDKETAKKLIKKGVIIVKAFEEGKEKIITVAVKKSE